MSDDDLSKFAGKFSIDSPRLKNWDYSTPGIYFITICTLNHNQFLGRIINDQMELSNKGMIAKQELIKTINLRSEIESLGWVIMPNHVHWLIRVLVETPRGASLIQQRQSNFPLILKNDQKFFDQTISNIIQQYPKETPRGASLHDNRPVTLINYGYKNHPDYYSRLNQKSNQTIPLIINQFKSSVKRICNQQHLFFAWQPRFHDEIIKDQNHFFAIKQYIKNNPKNWQKDEYNQ
jgi:REP element-mobilizing transposase RayT